MNTRKMYQSSPKRYLPISHFLWFHFVGELPSGQILFHSTIYALLQISSSTGIQTECLKAFPSLRSQTRQQTPENSCCLMRSSTLTFSFIPLTSPGQKSVHLTAFSCLGSGMASTSVSSSWYSTEALRSSRREKAFWCCASSPLFWRPALWLLPLSPPFLPSASASSSSSLILSLSISVSITRDLFSCSSRASPAECFFALLRPLRLSIWNQTDVFEMVSCFVPRLFFRSPPPDAWQTTTKPCSLMPLSCTVWGQLPAYY